MTFDEFQQFIDEQSDFYTSLEDPNNPLTEKEHIFARTIKISEEFGELCDEILAYYGTQRTSKMQGRSKESLSSEFADVLITVFMLAKRMDIDVLDALDKKTKVIKEKHNKDMRP